MKILTRTVRTLSGLVAAGILTASLATAPLVAHADPNVVPHTQHGCPAYAFCIYKRGGGWQGDTPIHWSFPPRDKFMEVHRWYNLSGMYGTHRVFNNGQSIVETNRSDWENVSLNTGYNGGGEQDYIDAGKFVDVRDMGPVNSVTLWHSALGDY